MAIPFPVRTWLSFREITYPGMPPASSMLATSTSQDHTSNCHFWRPRTPQSTEPEWMPMRMSTLCFSSLRTYLRVSKENGWYRTDRLAKMVEDFNLDQT